MDDLITWLTQILNEDTEMAHAAFSGQEDPENGWGEDGTAVTPHIGVIHEDAQRAHVVRWNPAAVLTMVAAHRGILEEVSKYQPGQRGYGMAAQAAKFLAMAYADRPARVAPHERISLSALIDRALAAQAAEFGFESPEESRT